MDSTSNRSSQVIPVLVAILITGSTLLIQCTQPPIEDSMENTTARIQKITHNGYDIELFDTPEQQLQYARTRLTDPNEKHAAFELVIERFSEAKTLRAEAELELAYLALGVDYRFADSVTCLHAIEKYKRIIFQYADLPLVCAKAHWYLGWIYADLLKQKRKAIAHYQTIVEFFPDATIDMRPPVPWAGLVLPQAIDRPMAVYAYPSYKWSSLALLEIIRNSEREDEKWTAFEKLWSGDRASLAMGYALRALVYDSPSLAQKAAAKARIYFAAQLFSQPIAEEVRIAMESLKSKGDPSAQ
jgi:tetratricopeptide (TPR) repeat protein